MGQIQHVGHYGEKMTNPRHSTAALWQMTSFPNAPTKNVKGF